MFLKSFKSKLRQFVLRRRFSRGNKIGRGVVFAGDAKMGCGCNIGDRTVIGKEVVIGDHVRIGSRVYLERVTIGGNSHIDSGCICTGHGDGSIVIGRECYVGMNNILDFSDHLEIGDFVHIAGPSTALWTHSSAPMCLNSIPLCEKDRHYRPTAPIRVEDNVYIGGNCTVYPGVTVAHHSIVAPNSAVSKNVESYVMAGGVPAKRIKDIRL